jgi:hypothetical protein
VDGFSKTFQQVFRSHASVAKTKTICLERA